MTTMITEVYDALKAAGAPEDKAQAAATVLANADNRFDRVDRAIEGLGNKVNREIADIKTDIAGLKIELKADIDRLEARMDAKFTGIKADIVQLEQRMTIRLGGMLVIIAGILLAAIRYLPPPIVVQSSESTQQIPHAPPAK
jgi:hypothetical protein